MIIELANIVAGPILEMGILPSIPPVGENLEKVVKWLVRFNTIIGKMAIVIGIYGLFF